MTKRLKQHAISQLKNQCIVQLIHFIWLQHTVTQQLEQVQEPWGFLFLPFVQLTANVRLFLLSPNFGPASGDAKEENNNKKHLMLRDMD